MEIPALAMAFFSLFALTPSSHRTCLRWCRSVARLLSFSFSLCLCEELVERFKSIIKLPGCQGHLSECLLIMRSDAVVHSLFIVAMATKTP